MAVVSGVALGVSVKCVLELRFKSRDERSVDLIRKCYWLYVL